MKTLRSVSLFLLLGFAAQAQVCAPVPLPGVSITQQTLDELRTRGAIAPGVRAFASLESFAMALGGSLLTLPQSSKESKFWADFTPGGQRYLTVDGSLDTSDMATWSDFSMNVYSQGVASFYQSRVKAKDPVFARIPRFKEFRTPQAAEMNMLAGVGRTGPRLVTMNETAYPLASYVGDAVAKWSWPANHMLRFHPDTGKVEACNYQDYDRAFPIITTVSVGGGAGSGIRVRGMTDENFLAAVGAALFGGGTPAERRAKVIALLEVF